ncbi:CGNR zinc finger domain-containing protein [Micromonosporaceae bacterium Da 78-11]
MPDEGALRVVREFVNTYDVESDVDALPTAADLTAWFRHAGLLTDADRADDTDLTHAIELREAIRDLLVGNHDGEVTPAAVATVDAAARRTGLRPRFAADGLSFVADGGPGDRALGGILAVIAQAMGDHGWARLKVCSSETCRWAFYDSSRSGGGRWCSMAVCGNRRKARAYRARQRG